MEVNMLELFGEDRLCTREFCIGREEEVILCSAVEGKMGRLWVDDKQQPGCTLIINGDFCYLLGSYNLFEAEALTDIISELCHGKIIDAGEQWEPVLKNLEKRYPNSFKYFSRYAVDGKKEWFDRRRLMEYAAAVEPDYEVVRIDENIYQLTTKQAWTLDYCSNFNSLEDYLEHGIGYVIVRKEDIISGASSYSYCDGRIEITIETREDFRKQGLALACAAKLILECLDRDIYPRWDAANIASVALAEKLGYRFSREYGVYSI
jgi:RimJ/RimL family protein N-acetyltransferase